MENTNNKKSRLGEIGIVILVLICAVFILAEMGTNLMKEIETQDAQAVITLVGVPTLGPLPTIPPDYTPDGNFDK